MFQQGFSNVSVTLQVSQNAIFTCREIDVFAGGRGNHSNSTLSKRFPIASIA